MASKQPRQGVIARVKNFCKELGIECEHLHITFKYKDKTFRISRVSKEENLYRLKVKRNGKAIYKDFKPSETYRVFSLIKELMKGNYDDDFNY